MKKTAKSSKKKYDHRNYGINRLRKFFPNVKTISDSRKRVEVRVLEKDQSEGVKHDFRSCALARACKRMKGIDGAFIGLTYSYLISGTHATRFVTPASVAREVVTFDRHKDFDIGDYHLGPVPPSRSLGTRTAPSSHVQSGRVHGTFTTHSTARVRRAGGAH